MPAWFDVFDAAPVRKVAKGGPVFRRGDRVQSMYLVRSGAVALERPMADGALLTLHVATSNMALAEASLFANAYHCDAVARTEAEVASLPRAVFLAFIKKHPDAALGLIETYAREIQAQRTRGEILRLRRVADRLDAWLDLYGEPAKGGWINVADQIGVSAAALYRELAKRRD